MKTIFLTTALFLFGFTAFSQREKKNGTVYIKHPNINAVNNAMKAYLAKDEATNRMIYADNATYWASGMAKPVAIDEAIQMWNSDFDYYNDIKLFPVGYPDYLHYVDKDYKTVQSFWRWSGKSKKTGVVVTIDFVRFDIFNKDGKIVEAGIYGDFSKLVKE